eukprot:gene2737-13821_t
MSTEPAQPAPRFDGVPPAELESTDTDASVEGDDYQHCVQMITDNDTLLRAAQGHEPFWGEGRLDALQRQLVDLQRAPSPTDAPPR